MNFFKRLFKSETKTLAKTTVKLVPLNQVGQNEKIRKTLIKYLVKKHGKTEAQKIINNSNYGVAELIPGSPMMSIHTKDDQCFGSFYIVDDKIEESEIIDPKSKEGKTLYNHV